MNVDLIAHTQNPERVVAAAAKLCYSDSSAMDVYDSISDAESGEFIVKLRKLGHQSPLEHANFTFAISGVSRSLLAQLTRHRIASYSVQSQRYVDFSAFTRDDTIVPVEIGRSASVDIFCRAMENALTSYNELKASLTCNHLANMFGNAIEELSGAPISNIMELEPELQKRGIVETSEDPVLADLAANINNERKKYAKIATENARAVLPNAMPTELIVTMNARELLHYFEERCCNRAQEEHRELAWRMLDLVQDIAPNIFWHAGPTCLYEKCKEGKSCGKPFKLPNEHLSGKPFTHICVGRAFFIIDRNGLVQRLGRGRIKNVEIQLEEAIRHD